MTDKTFRWVGAVFSTLAIIGIFYFLARNLASDWNQISWHDFRPDIALLIASSVGFLITLCILPVMWAHIVHGLGESISIRESIKIYFISQLGKYLPGKIWLFAGKVYISGKYGVQRESAAAAVVLEVGFMMLSGILVGTPMIFIGKGGISVAHLLWMTAMMSVGILIIHPSVFLSVGNCVLQRLGRQPVDVRIDFRRMLLYLMGYCTFWIVFGMSFFDGAVLQ